MLLLLLLLPVTTDCVIYCNINDHIRLNYTVYGMLFSTGTGRATYRLYYRNVNLNYFNFIHFTI